MSRRVRCPETYKRKSHYIPPIEEGGTGALGAFNSSGSTGEAGQTGQTGKTGETGNTGQTGETGALGATGSDITGATGKTGASVVGSTGFSSGTGSSGNAGKTGVTGVTGMTGSTGKTGFTGAVVSGVVISGATGAPGEDALVPGREGAAGADGLGIVGPPGFSPVIIMGFSSGPEMNFSNLIRDGAIFNTYAYIAQGSFGYQDLVGIVPVIDLTNVDQTAFVVPIDITITEFYANFLLTNYFTGTIVVSMSARLYVAVDPDLDLFAPIPETSIILSPSIQPGITTTPARLYANTGPTPIGVDVAAGSRLLVVFNVIGFPTVTQNITVNGSATAGISMTSGF